MYNSINWFSIPTSDYERGVAFYETILDTSMPRMEMDGTKMAFFQEMESEGVNGDINDSDDVQPGASGVLIFLNVEGKIDEVLSRVEEAGGSIQLPKTNIGEWGFIARLTDTEGNVIGLHSTT